MQSAVVSPNFLGQKWGAVFVQVVRHPKILVVLHVCFHTFCALVALFCGNLQKYKKYNKFF